MPSRDVDHAKAILSSALVSLTIDTLFFGLFSGACALTLWWLVTKPSPPRSVLGRIGPVVTLAIMFVLALAYLVLDIDASMDGFVASAGNLDSMMHGLTDIRPDTRSHWSTKMTILFVQILLADAFMVFRLYDVWDRKHWAAFTPALFSLAALLAGAMMVAYLFHLEDDITGGARTGLFFGFSFVSSGLCAVLIIGRRIRAHARSGPGKPRLPVLPYLPRAAILVADVIIQSAVVYCAASLGLLIYVVIGFPQARPNWIIGGMPSFIGITTSAIVLWELLAVDAEPEDETEKLHGETA
ncbi:hypothetical protein OH76DRAFT_1483506 [Lentinus brumalis]|uniref:Uncharacterized protein n=1 Tax=Lentinus brumalis TaxID=2498619 RepID=A0A371D909_9APHY|nr:hypothetical protein OH76DRAFT_1483506 [Polyporus brumalis]